MPSLDELWKLSQQPAARPSLDALYKGDAAPAPAAKPPEKPGFMAGALNSAADFFKSIPTGLAKATREPGAFGTQGALEAPDPALDKARQGATAQLHQPEGFAGRVGQSLGEAATNPAIMTPMGGAARTGASILGGVAGGQAGSELGEKAAGPVGGVIGGLLGGAVGGLAGGTKLIKEPPAPVRRAVDEAAEAAYNQIKTSKRQIPMEESSLLAENLRNKLNEEGVFREAPEGVAVFKTIDRLGGAVNAGHITPAEVHSITKTLQKIGSSNPGNATGRAAQLARQEIFTWLEQFPELKEAISVGNANYRAARTSERLGLAQEKGEMTARGTMTGDNIDPALRTQLRQMYFNKKVSKTPEESKLLKQIIEGDTASNIAKTFRMLKTPVRHMASAVLHAKGAGMLTHAAEIVAKSIANRNTAKQVDKLDEMVRRNSPAAGPHTPLPPQMSRGAQRGIQAARGAAIAPKQDDRPRIYEGE